MVLNHETQRFSVYLPYSREFLYKLPIRKSTFCQKVTVHKDPKSPSISNLKNPACASKRDVLELATLW